MFLSISFYVALIIFLIGLLFKVVSWFRCQIGDEAREYSTGARAAAALKGLLAGLFSLKFFSALKILVLDGLLQRRVLRNGFGRWLMHICLYGGFTLLLLMHALDDQITKALFSDAEATLNPFLFLRNLFGVAVAFGAALAIWRRVKVPGMRLTTRAVDRYALILVALIIVSGFCLESLKIVSHVKFKEMIENYSSLSPEGDADQIKALKAYWAAEYSVVFPPGEAEITPENLELGSEVHEENCAVCHSRPTWAFASYGLAQVIRPAALGLTRAGLDQAVWYVHFLACFVGLALLPFTKFFHLITSPLLLMLNGVTDRSKAHPANRATLRALDLDACTHCATCSVHCSVGVVFKHIPNLNILPSEKLAALASLSRGNGLRPDQLQAIQQGAYICSSCYRCTQICPVGINLQDLWFAMKEELARIGLPETFISVRAEADRAAQASRSQAVLEPAPGRFQIGLGLSALASTFKGCFECQTCTNVCPVVQHFDQPVQELKLLPHQIMHSLGLGLSREAVAAGMTWDCLTCYRCQEACPQGVRVCDVLFELKNLAAQAAQIETEAV